jgi:AraC family transcriptional regulator, ethanolamine operon transcriptional activator
MTSTGPPGATSEPAVTIVEITDPIAAGAEIELLDLHAMQLQSIPLRARRVIVRLESAAVVFHSTNLRMRTRTRALKGLLACVTFGPQTNGTANGLPVRPDVMLVVEPESEVQFVTNAAYESIAFLLPPEEIRSHLAARQRAGDLRLPRGAEILQASAEKVRGLFSWGKRLVDIAARQPDLFNGRKSEQVAAYVDLLEVLLATLDGATEVESDRSVRARQSHSRIVKIAEDYALSNLGDRVSVTGLCRAAGVSERTLENAFKEVMGLTPMNYMVRLRLHRVRQSLLTGTQGSTTVSAEALNWGFWHFGEFSRAYRDCFGELPSDTLRRKPHEAKD